MDLTLVTCGLHLETCGLHIRDLWAALRDLWVALETRGLHLETRGMHLVTWLVRIECALIGTKRGSVPRLYYVNYETGTLRHFVRENGPVLVLTLCRDSLGEGSYVRSCV